MYDFRSSAELSTGLITGGWLGLHAIIAWFLQFPAPIFILLLAAIVGFPAMMYGAIGSDMLTETESRSRKKFAYDED